MTIPTRPIPTATTTPPPAEFRRYLTEVAQTAIMHCHCAQDMAQIGDDDALAYHLSGMIGAARLARDVMRDFRAAHHQEDRQDAA